MSVLLRGGRIHSPAAPHATAMLVVDGRVAWLGSDGGALVHADGVDQVVELGGAYVAPAFVDAHVHHTATGLALLGLDLRPARSLAEALGMLAGRARAGGSPIVGHGWDETAWPEGRPPTRPELDRAAGGAVVYLSRVDVHSAVVSSALVAAVPGLVDAVGFGAGPLTQHAHEQARRALTKTIPGDLRRAAQRAARQHAAASGVAALHEMAGPSVNGRDDLRALVALAAAEPGPELTAYWGEAGALDELAGLGAIGAAGDLFVDGSLGSRTALLRDPYADAGGFGVGYLDGDQVAAHLVACTGAGISGGFHAIGDAAVGLVVEGIRVAVQRCGLAAVRAARHRIEHLVMCSPAEAEVLAHAGVVGSIQPQFDATWGGPGGAYEQRLGPVRAARVNECKITGFIVETAC